MCKMCGECCRKFAISVTYSDIIRWRDEKRDDIISEIYWYNGKLGQGFYFTKTLTAINGKSICPFLKENKCSINDTKPLRCKTYPIKTDYFLFCKDNENLVENTQAERFVYNDCLEIINKKKEVLQIIEESLSRRILRD